MVSRRESRSPSTSRRNFGTKSNRRRGRILLADHWHGIVSKSTCSYRDVLDAPDRDELNARIRSMGYLSWMAFINVCHRGLVPESVDEPTVEAFRMVSRTVSRAVYERNPYYFKVDPAGQQLPYIDTVRSDVVPDWISFGVLPRRNG